MRLMKPMPQLATLLKKAKAKGIFGTKMRSVINQANLAGIRDIVDQQFGVAAQILAAGLVPIVEPEVDIHCPEKAKAEALLKIFILEKLDQLPAGQLVFLKLTLPEQDDLYADCVRHPKVVRVLALSGGYSRDEANERLRRNHGVVASFSRALVEGLTAQQSDAEFNPAALPFHIPPRYVRCGSQFAGGRTLAKTLRENVGTDRCASVPAWPRSPLSITTDHATARETGSPSSASRSPEPTTTTS